ncbi:MAG: CHAT domain-containing protein, partial [Candidatus Eisenbacteria bacterium]|nr:CHAT domain-containing protein [Candidatus Eisenbacteria bacterium]
MTLTMWTALACPTQAGASSFLPTRGPAAAALRECEAGRFGAAESALAAIPAPAGPAAPLDREQAQAEYARFVARGFAPGMGDTTWEWRGARLVASLERLGAGDRAIAAAWVERSRVEYRLGMWRPAEASARAALARLDAGRVRDVRARYRAHLALVEATSTQQVVVPRAHLAIADSLARLSGAATARDRARHLRLAGTVALSADRLAVARAYFAEAVTAADALQPVDEGERGLALVFQGFIESLSDAVRGDAMRAEAARRMEEKLGFSDERTLLVIGRSVASLRDPARLPDADARFERIHAFLRDHGLDGRAAAWDVDYFHSRIQYHLRRYERCHELLTHALEVNRRWNGTENVREMHTHIDWGNVIWAQKPPGAVEQAGAHYRRAVEIGLGLEPMFFNDPSVTRINFASMLAEQGHLTEARGELAAAWETYRDRHGETFRLCSLPAYMAARSSRALGDTAAATLWFRRAMAPFSTGESGEREDVANVREAWSLFEWSRGEAARAFDMASYSATLRRQVIVETAPWLPDNDALRFATNRRIIAGLLNTIGMKWGGATPDMRREAWSSTVGGRGLVLESMLRRVRVQSDTSVSARSAGALRRELATQVIAALRAPDTREQALRRDSLRAEIRHRELEGGGPAADMVDVTVDAVAGRLGTNGALVSYSRFSYFDVADSRHHVWAPRDWYAAFVLRPGDPAPRVVELGRADSIDAALSAWRQALLVRGASPEARAAGERVRKLVWDPLGSGLAGASDVYVVPDGELHKLNWYALPVGRDRFLVDEPFVLHRLNHERELLAPAVPPGSGMLALGGMQYDGADSPVVSAAPATQRLLPSCRSFLDERFEALPASLGEARAVSALGRRLAAGADTSRVQMLTGAAADEGAFKRLAPGRRVVHLAT